MGAGGRLRRVALGRLAVVAFGVAVGAAVTGCATSSHVQVEAPSSAGASGSSGGSSGTGPGSVPSEPQQAVPEVGDCRGPVDVEIIDAAADSRATVTCDQPHGTETFWVGEMDPSITSWPGNDPGGSDALGRQVDRECTTRHLDYLGFNSKATPNLPPDRLQVFAFFMPTEEDFAAGARWFRCDALVEPLSAAETTTIEGTLDGVYGKPLPVAYRLCEARLGRTTACDQEHEIEYLASVALDDLTEYPPQRGDLQVTAACRTPLLAALGLTVERADLVFGYLLPTREAWDFGPHGATCVVGATDRSPLEGSLADIGPTAPLPLAPG